MMFAHSNWLNPVARLETLDSTAQKFELKLTAQKKCHNKRKWPVFIFPLCSFWLRALAIFILLCFVYAITWKLKHCFESYGFFSCVVFNVFCQMDFFLETLFGLDVKKREKTKMQNC